MNIPIDNGIQNIVSSENEAVDHENSDVTYTEDGLVLKNTKKIEAINTRMEMRTDACYLSWQICRIVRRDFNLLSTKMFINATNSKRMAQIRDLLQEMAAQAEFLKGEAGSFPLYKPNEPKFVSLRIISPDAGLLLRILNDVDNIFARVSEASSGGFITLDKQEQIFYPFLFSYSELKGFLLRQRDDKNKSANQLGSEQGIL